MDNVIKEQLYDLDLTDSVIESIHFSEGKTDFILEITHYYGEDQLITITFKNCEKVNYEIASEIYELNDNKLNFSQFTITNVEVTDEIKLYTFDDKKPLLAIRCKEMEIK